LGRIKPGLRTIAPACNAIAAASIETSTSWPRPLAPRRSSAATTASAPKAPAS